MILSLSVSLLICIIDILEYVINYIFILRIIILIEIDKWIVV